MLSIIILWCAVRVLVKGSFRSIDASKATLLFFVVRFGAINCHFSGVVCRCEHKLAVFFVAHFVSINQRLGSRVLVELFPYDFFFVPSVDGDVTRRKSQQSLSLSASQFDRRLTKGTDGHNKVAHENVDLERPESRPCVMTLAILQMLFNSAECVVYIYM